MFALNNSYKYILIIFALTLFLLPPVNIDSLWLREAINSGHTALFIFMPFIVYPLVNGTGHENSALIQYIYIFAICFAAGIVIELLQTVTHREASLTDIYGNFYGIISGLCLHAVVTRQRIRGNKNLASLLITGSVLFALAGITPLMRLSWHYLERMDAFPVIADFDSGWSDSFLQYNENSYPGVSIIEPQPDWSGYQSLYLRVHSAGSSSIDMMLRVHDRTHNNEYTDRFNIRLAINPGFNEFHIPVDTLKHGPVSRELDMKRIAGVILYCRELSEWLNISISNIYLK